MDIRPRLVCLLALVVVATVTVSRLTKWPVPLGRDGYYYTAQAHSIQQSGVPRYATTSLLPVYVLAVMGSTSRDQALVNKIAITVCLVVFGALVFEILLRWTGDTVMAVTGLAIATVSSLAAYFVVEFFDNLVGLVCVAGYLLYSIRGDSGWRWLIAFVFAFGCALLVHPSAALVVGGLACLSGRDRALLRVVGVCATCFAAVLALHAARSGYLSATVLRALQEVRLIPVVPRSSVGRWESGLLAFGCVGQYWRNITGQQDQHEKSRQHIVNAVVIVALLLCLNPFVVHAGNGGVFERLSMWSLLFASLLFPLSVYGWQSSGSVGRHRWSRVGAAVAVVGSLVGARPPGAETQFMTERVSLARSLSSFPRCSADDLVIAEHGLQFMLTDLTGCAAASRMYGSGAGRNVMWLLRSPARWPAVAGGTWYAPGWVLIRDDRLVDILASDKKATSRLVVANPFHLGFGRLGIQLSDVMTLRNRR